MKLYIANWKDGTVSILSAKSKKHLRERLLREDKGLPYSVREYAFDKKEDIHFTTTLPDMVGGGVLIAVGYCGTGMEGNVVHQKIEL